jgi:predicted nucleic-acid-binding Zn-ribbon protein
MTRQQAAKCPKCGGEMKPGRLSTNFRILKPNDWYGDPAVVLYCENCGFVELYKEPSAKEPRKETETLPEQEQPQQPVSEEEPQKPRDRERDKRLIR